MIELMKCRVVYTAPGLDGAVHRVTAVNSSWSLDIARKYAADDLRDRTGSVPSDISEIEILEIVEVSSE